MNTNKWLKKRYPIHHKMISIIFTEDIIKKYLKEYNYKLAILEKKCNIFEKGTLFLVKRLGHMGESGWDGTHDIYGLFYSPNYTASGYNHTDIFSEDYYHIINTFSDGKGGLNKDES